MAIKVETRNCTSLNRSDLEDLAAVCVESSNAFDAKFLSAQAESWVLLTAAWVDHALAGFAFCTLDRIGGTPCVLIGTGYICRTDERSEILENIIADQMRRAGMSFPDEDVLFNAQINEPGAFEAFNRFHDVIPRPDYASTGEDRAWGKRLAKRLGIGMLSYEDRIFTSRAKQWPPTVLDHESLKHGMNSPETASLLEHAKRSDGDTVLVYGWARSEEMEALL